MPKTPPIEYFYPEKNAGGFTHVSSTIDFYNRINALLHPDMTVLDFGAGRGAMSEDKIPYPRELRRMKGKVRKFVGADVDPVVSQNPMVDEAMVITPDGPLPFADHSFDMIICDWVFEHLSDTAAVIRELHRILKPGGWICGRTPNRWGYIAVGASLVPEWLHSSVLRRVQPTRKECDVFPKFYRLNSLGQIARQFGAHDFENYTYALNSEPAYAGNSRMLWRLFFLIFRLTPPQMNAILHVFLKKSTRD